MHVKMYTFIDQDIQRFSQSILTDNAGFDKTILARYKNLLKFIFLNFRY